MTLRFIGLNVTPNYLAESTDIVSEVIAGASNIGLTVFLTDTYEWRIIDRNLELIPIPLSGNMGASATQVSPVAQTSTDTLTLVAGSTMDTLNYRTIAYTIKNTHGTNGVTWSVFGANASDLSDKVIVSVGATLAAGISASYSATAVYRYYAVYEISTLIVTPGQLTVRGIAKG